MAQRIVGKPSNAQVAIDLSGVTYASGGAVDFVDYQEEKLHQSCFNYDFRFEDHAIADRQAKREREQEILLDEEIDEEIEEEPIDPEYPSGPVDPPFGDDEEFSIELFDS
jgi:hypothetical protein